MSPSLNKLELISNYGVQDIVYNAQETHLSLPIVTTNAEKQWCRVLMKYVNELYDVKLRFLVSFVKPVDDLILLLYIIQILFQLNSPLEAQLCLVSTTNIRKHARWNGHNILSRSLLFGSRSSRSTH